MSFPAYPEYRDSGVAWLGAVPSNWEVVQGRRQFRQVREPSREVDEQLSASQRYGVIPQSRLMQLEDQKVVLALKGLEGFKHVNPDDFVISLRSFQGGIEHSLYSGCVSPAYTVLRPSREQVARFFTYALKSQPYISALQAVTDGIRDGKNISFEQFGQVGLPLPSLFEQAAIAAFLDRETAKIDRLVAEQERLIALLKEKRQAVISHAVTKGLNPNAPMKDSGIAWLGEIPAHWEVKRLKHIGEAITGLTYSPEDVVPDGGVLVLRSSNVQNGKVLLEDNVYVSVQPSMNLMVQPNDILVCSRNGSRALIGKNAILTEDHVGMTWGAFMTVFRSKMPRWAFWVLNSEIFAQQSSTFLTATINQLTIGNFYSMSAPVPPADEQAQIDQILTEATKKLGSLIAEAQSAITLLQERRAALISAAVTGKIDVRGAVPEAA